MSIMVMAASQSHGTMRKDFTFRTGRKARCAMPMESAQEVERRDAGQSDVILSFTADKSDMMPATVSRSWNS